MFIVEASPVIEISSRVLEESASIQLWLPLRPLGVPAHVLATRDVRASREDHTEKTEQVAQYVIGLGTLSSNREAWV